VPIKMGVQVIVVFKEICQEELGVVVWELIFDLKEVLVRSKYESLELGLKILKVRIVLESELHHVSRVIDLFVFIKYIESL
jgi:hypothetical protein